MSDTNRQTNITVNGKLTVTVNLKDSIRRHSAPDLQTEIPLVFGAPLSEIEMAIDKHLTDLRQRLLIACGKGVIEE
jgi:hypothetical protein